MNFRLSWLARIAADPKVGATATRLAVAIAGMADDADRLCIRLSDLSPVCQISSRRMRPFIDELIGAGYLADGPTPKQGTLNVQIAMPQGSKTMRTMRGQLVSIDALAPKFRLFIEAEDEVISLTIDRRDARAIARAITPPAR